MNAAITQLEVYLDTLETNETINRAEGSIEQAYLERHKAFEVAQAINALRERMEVTTGRVEAPELSREEQFKSDLRNLLSSHV